MLYFLKSFIFFRNAADQEAVEGRLAYYPASRAIPISYFPYLVITKTKTNNDKNAKTKQSNTQQKTSPTW